MSASRVLVTGAGGRLGRALGDVLGDRMVGLERETLDVADHDAVVRAVAAREPHAIVNAAAFTDVDACETDPDRAHAVNAQGAGNVAHAAAEAGAFCVQVSTDFVFDGDAGRAYLEDDEPNPLSIYGMTKAQGERLARAAGATIVRTAWVYGPDARNFVAAILAAARAGRRVDVVDDQSGSPTWAPDLAAAIVSLVDRPAPGVFHVAGRGEASRYDLARAAVEAAGFDPTLVRACSTAEMPRPAPRPAYAPLDGPAWRAAGFAALRDWRDALADAAPRVLAAI